MISNLIILRIIAMNYSLALRMLRSSMITFSHLIYLFILLNLDLLFKHLMGIIFLLPNYSLIHSITI